MMSLPGGALIPPAVMTVIYLSRKNSIYGYGRKISIFIIIFWSVYGIYETYMYYWMKTVIAPIRVDLLLLTPVLYLLIIVFAVVILRTFRHKSARSTLQP